MIADTASGLDKATLTRWLLQNPDKWIDLYDTEHIDNRLLRRATRGLLWFCPQILLHLRVANRSPWPEAVALLGLSAVQCNDKEMGTSAFAGVLSKSDGDYHWGLPVKWHSGDNVFPPGTMMSTTTAEVAWFLLELDRRYQCVGRETLEHVGFSMANNLYRAIDDGKRLQFAYTPYPGEPVNNSNLLVASVLWRIGCYVESTDLMSTAKRISLTSLEGLDSSGGITYFRGSDIVDSYHQLFSIRALYAMRDMDPSVGKWFELTLDYFERIFIDSRGGVLVRTDKPFYDMISSAEALRLYRMIGNSDKYHSILRHIQRDLVHRGRVVQRVWFTPIGTVHSKAVFTRQGLARLALGLEP